MNQMHHAVVKQRDVIRFVRALKKVGFNDAGVMIAVSSRPEYLIHQTADCLISLRSITRNGRLPWSPEVYHSELVRIAFCAREKLQSFPPMV